MIGISINGQAHEFPAEVTVLEAARLHGVDIPTLCHNDMLTPYGGCRICLVEVVGRRGLMPACSTTITDGMVVHTETEKVQEARRFVISLLLARCPDAQGIRDLAVKLGVAVDRPDELDVVSRYLLQRAEKRDGTDCVLCNLCVRTCAQIPQRHALTTSGRGISRRVATPFEKFADSCIGCGSCAYVCPTKTITIAEVT